MPSSVFVGREAELSRLGHVLSQASAGAAQVVFVAGEAGAGKSALVNEFVGRALKADATVVAAVGECNAQTGLGDPYLPFRQLLTELTTGADEALASAKGETGEAAQRLQDFVRLSAATLLTVGPDLVGIFVPGASLFAKIAAAAASHGKLADKLADRIGKKEEIKTGKEAKPELDQQRIFEQYTAVLRALAKEQPLILVLDDLQWADDGSLSLLFHLARELKDSRVMLLGTYRPDDVALGRRGERHPLESILGELKRYYGDIVIDLGAAESGEGRAFVDALLDAEPNQLDSAFRQELFAHTGGHPLFTVEMLRNLQERGDLVKDAEGRWITGATLDWQDLPARVEGVIGERIARLPDDLHETLSVASVVGYDFTAQVVARVQQAPERDLLRNLSRELEKRHHLVLEMGESKAGAQFLSQYRFTHALIQQFVYNDLSAGERRLLHGDIASSLEQLYAGQTDDIVVQLAHHFQESGNDEKASAYFIQAGDAAARMYAAPEARVHYAQALADLERLPASPDYRRLRVDTIIKQVSVSLRAVGPLQTLERLQRAVDLLGDPNGNLNTDDPADQRRRAQLDYWIGHAYVHAGQQQQAIAYMQRVLTAAQELNDAELMAIPSSVIGRALVLQGHFDQAVPLLSQALPLLEAVGNWHEWILAGAIRGFVMVARGRVSEGIEAGQQTLAQALAVKTATGIGQSYLFLAMSYWLCRDWAHILEQAQLGLDTVAQTGDQFIMAQAWGLRSIAHEQMGALQTAAQDDAQAQAIAQRMGGQMLFFKWVALGHAEAAIERNQLQEALALAEPVGQGAGAADDIYSEGWAQRVLGDAKARLEPPLWDEAEAHLAASLRLFNEGDARLPAARTQVVWGQVLARRGDASGARGHLEQAAAQYEQSGLLDALAATRKLLEGL